MDLGVGSSLYKAEVVSVLLICRCGTYFRLGSRLLVCVFPLFDLFVLRQQVADPEPQEPSEVTIARLDRELSAVRTGT